MGYIPNPKTKGSGVVAAIPHHGECPNKCPDCFYQSGRSYLEPLEENTPNMPPIWETLDRVVRVNDGHDSGIDPEMVMHETRHYKMKFHNTSIGKAIYKLTDAPVVLTINPGDMTDKSFHLAYAVNLMMVRFRVNTWNLKLADSAVKYYASKEVPIIFTFMAYYNDEEKIPEGHKQYYELRNRTTNKYFAIKRSAWRDIMARYQDKIYEKWVYSCGKVEGEKPIGDYSCVRCGNCLREYFATMERIKVCSN